MNLSTEPSIETLPEYYANGTNVVDTNVINDQTIANFCSDTVRELNSLTEELQHSDLNEIGVPLRHHHESLNSFNCSSKSNESTLDATSKSVHDAEPHKPSVHPSLDDSIQSTPNATSADVQQNNLIIDHNLMVSYYNRTMLNGKSSEHNETSSCDDVDSSPYYTQYTAHLENNMDNDIKTKSRISMNNSHHSQDDAYPYANGRASSEASKDSDYRVAMCMLQSVDLRGINSNETNSSATKTKTKQCVFHFRHFATVIITTECSNSMAWKC